MFGKYYVRAKVTLDILQNLAFCDLTEIHKSFKV